MMRALLLGLVLCLCGPAQGADGPAEALAKAEATLRRDDPRDALVQFSTVFKAAGNDAQRAAALRGMAECHLRLDAQGKADQCLAQALALKGLTPATRGALLLRRAEMASMPRLAIAYYSAFLSLPEVAPDLRRAALLGRARAYRKRVLDEQALRDLQAATALPAPSPQAGAEVGFALGRCARDLRRIDTALQAFTSVAEGPKVPAKARAEALLERGRTRLFPQEYDWQPADEDLEGARADYSRAQEMAGGVAPETIAAAWQALAGALRRQGKLEEAIKTYEQAIALKPLPGDQQKAICNAAAACYSAWERPGDAVKWYERTLTAPNMARDVDTLKALAWAARQANDYNRAQKAYSDLLPLLDEETGRGWVERQLRQLTEIVQQDLAPTETDLNRDEDGDLDDLTLEP